MAAAHGGGTGSSGPSKAKWALIHRVPIYGKAGTRAYGHIVGWKPLTQWVKVGGAKWNRIHAAAHKAGVTITPTKYVKAVNKPMVQTKLPAGAKLPAGHKSDTVIVKNGKIVGAKNAKGQVVAGGGKAKAPPRSGGNGPPKTTTARNQRTVGSSIGKANVQKLVNVNKAARAAGAASFAAPIADNKMQQLEQGRQGAQDLADITHWYAALAKQNAAGAAANVASTTAASNHVGNIASSLIDQIGGSANQNSGTLGNHAIDAIQAIMSAGQGQQAFEQNRGEADTAAQAGQMSAQQALNSQNMVNLQQALRDLQIQRGATVTAAKASLIGQNNAALQANFGNRIARLDAMLGAAQAAGNQQIQGLQIAQGRQQLKQLKSAGSKNGNPNFVPWAKLSTSGKLSAINAMIGGDPSKTPKAVAIARGHAMGFAPQYFLPLLNTYYGH